MSSKETENLEALTALMFDLVKFGFINDYVISSIVAVMLELYSKEAKIYLKTLKQEMDGEDPYPYAETSGLFKHVLESKQKQYLIDFRNVIDHYLKTSSYEVEGVALEIKQLRKISKDWWN